MKEKTEPSQTDVLDEQQEKNDLVFQQEKIDFRNATIRFAAAPLLLLGALLAAVAVLMLEKLSSYVVPFPTALTIAGVIVAFIGAYYDFGAKKYLDDMFKNRVNVPKDEVEHINRQQLIMTVIFFGIGGLYVLAAFSIFYLVL